MTLYEYAMLYSKEYAQKAAQANEENKILSLENEILILTERSISKNIAITD